MCWLKNGSLAFAPTRKANPSAKAKEPFAYRHKITRLINLLFSGARESLRLFELKKMCGGENKK
ncbi:hypothetical protein JCM31826_04410 [Thermaurantimonas aggregans]|uniref:Uncharacterized protein n=1 Tax=Thermaurantimonas aggregans TaxID=2173829 RepID=A0A401XIW2_9FLAO|nr:hypothetical protein JCM31826_04410 [Thermaurantimonas aggregans]